MVIIEEQDSNSTKFEPNNSTSDDNDAKIDNMCHNSRKNSHIYTIIIKVFMYIGNFFKLMCVWIDTFVVRSIMILLVSLYLLVKV